MAKQGPQKPRFILKSKLVLKGAPRLPQRVEDLLREHVVLWGMAQAGGSHV